MTEIHPATTKTNTVPAPTPATGTTTSEETPKRTRLPAAAADLVRKALRTLDKEKAANNIAVRSQCIEWGCNEMLTDKQINAIRRAGGKKRVRTDKKTATANELADTLLSGIETYEVLRHDFLTLAQRYGGMRNVEKIAKRFADSANYTEEGQ